MHSALICLKFQICLHLIFCNCQSFQGVFCICAHKGCCRIGDCLLVIFCDLYIIISCFFLKDTHQLNIFQCLLYCLLAISLAFLCLCIPDRIIRSAHKALVHGLCLRLTLSDRKA